MSPPRTEIPGPIAILTASFGDGHNAAARGVAAALEEQGHPHTGAMDLLSELRPETMRWLGSGYRTLITRWPWGWKALYAAADRMPLGGDTPDPLPRLTRGVAGYLNQLQPAAIVSTYPLYAHLIERLFGAGPLPFGLLTVVTDSTSVNRSWVSTARGHYAVADPQSANGLIAAGVAEDRIHVTGFPVHPAFGRGRPNCPEAKAPSPFRVIYTPSTKSPEVASTLGALSRFSEKSDATVEITVVLGRHHARLASVAERHAPPGATVLGWTDQMPELLKNGHLLIGKAGGATVQEALAAGCPMLVNKVVPGQEEGNAELLCRSGAGAMMPPPAELTDYLLNLVQSKNGASWKTMRQRSISTGRPGAAEAIADLALRLCKS